MVFNKEWFIKHQVKLLWLANSWLGRKLLKIDNSNKIIGILPNSIYWKKGDGYIAEFRTHDKYAKRLFYAFKPVWLLIHAWDILFANNWRPEWNLGFDTLTAYPAAGANSPVDGYVQRGVVDESLATIRSGAGQNAFLTDSSAGMPELTSSSTNPNFRQLSRGIYCFNSSALTAGATITAAVLSLFADTSANQFGGSPEIDIVASTPAATNTLAASDYGQVASTPFASIAFGSWSAGGYNNFTLDSNGIANVSKTGISKFGSRVNWDTDNSFTGVWGALSQVRFNHFLADETGTTKDPKLVVTYTTPGGSFLLNML